MSTMNITPIELDQIQKQHCKGYFKDFPPEVVFKLLYYLQRRFYIGKIDYDKLPDRVLNGYIDFRETSEGSEFWKKVILHKNFALYFNRYPPIYYTDISDFSTRYQMAYRYNNWYSIGVNNLKPKEKPLATLPEESLYENIKLKKDGKRIY